MKNLFILVEGTAKVERTHERTKSSVNSLITAFMFLKSKIFNWELRLLGRKEFVFQLCKEKVTEGSFYRPENNRKGEVTFKAQI